MATKSTAPQPVAHTFETAIERLESIVEQMESDKMPLEELLVRYEEGARLVTVCEEKLSTAEKRIEILTRSSSGKMELAAFEPGTDPEPAAAVKPSSKSDQDVSLF